MRWGWQALRPEKNYEHTSINIHLNEFIMNNLKDQEIALLKEMHGDDKVAAYLEVAKSVEAGEHIIVSKEDVEKIVENMKF